MPWPSSAVNSGPRRLSQAHGITETCRNSQPTCSAAFCSSPADPLDVQSQAQPIPNFATEPHDQQRALQNLLGCGRVLDELHHRILVDDLARRDRQVLADLKLGRISLSYLEATAPAFDVLGQKLHAAHQVLAIRREGLVQ